MSSDLAAAWVFLIGVPMTGSSGDDSVYSVPSSCSLSSPCLPESASELDLDDSSE